MLDCPPRFGTPRNESRDTIGPEIAQTMIALGYKPHPWQRYVLDVAGELDDDGTLHYSEARLTIPRQSGKTSLLHGLHVHRMQHSDRWDDPRPLTLYTAQNALAARQKFAYEWAPMLETSACPGFVRFFKSAGREALEFDNGGRIATFPPTLTGAHGMSNVGLVSLDEVFAYSDSRAEQGSRPTQIVHPSPQFWITSTAGTTESAYLWGKVEDGRARTISGDHGSVCYFEWSATDEDDPGSPETWRRCSPSLDLTIHERVLRQSFESMDIDDFRRSFLNVWTSSQARIIPAAAWQKCLDSASTISGRCWFAVDSSPERTASISVGGRNMHGVPHVEVVKHMTGLDWVAEEVHRLTRSHPVDGVILDPRGPIGSIAPDIERSSNCSVTYADAPTMANAAGRFLSDVMGGNVRHLGQEQLDAAVDGAAKRQLLDSWAFARRTSTTDISPLVSSVLAHWAVVTHPAFSMPSSF